MPLGPGLLGGLLKGFKKHGIDQVINRGVTPEALRDALKNPRKIRSGIDELARLSHQYVGRKATIVLDEWNKVITAWSQGGGR